MTRRTRGTDHSRRAIGFLAFVVSLIVLVVTWPRTADAARIAQAYSPGVTAAALGGDLVVNSYGVAGLGLFRMAIDDGTSAAAVCIQADVSHSTAANYQVAAPAFNSGALDYLTWRYLRGASVGGVQAAGLNLAAWSLTGARRNVGGVVWQGGTLTVAVLGVGPRDDIESAAISLLGESTRRRGPWTLTAQPISGTTVSVQLAGPGGTIANEAVSFTTAGGSSTDVVTNAEGIATFSPPDAAAGSAVGASAVGPGRSVEYVAAGSQRLAVAGPPALLEVEIARPAAPTTSMTSTTSIASTSTSTTSTTSTSTSTTSTPTTSTATTPVPATSTTAAPTSTTSVPATSTTAAPTSTTVAPATTVPGTRTTTSTSSSVAPAATTTTTTTSPTTRPPDTTDAPTSTSTTSTTAPVPPDSPVSPGPEPPPDIPATGSSSRTVVRIGALLFALGSIAMYVAAGTRRNPAREVDLDGRDR